MKRKLCLLLLISIFGYFNLQAQIPKPKPKPKYETYEIDDLDHTVAKPPRIRGNSMGTYIENQKYGVKVNDTIVSKPIYDNVKINSPYGFIVQKDGKYGFINRKAEEVIAIKYDSIGLFNGRSPALLVKKSNLFGVVSHKGQTILAVKHSKVLGCNHSLLCAVKDKKGKFQLYKNNKKVFKHHLDKIHLYENGIVVGYDEKYGFVNQFTTTKIEYDTISRIGFWNNRRNRNQRAFPAFYSFGSMKLLDRLVVRKDEKFGMIDLSGKLIVPIEHDQIYYDERSRYYHITKGRKKGTYLTQCNKFIPAEYDRMSYDKRQLKVTKDGKVGLISLQTGTFIIPLKYTDVKYLNDIYRDNIRGEFYEIKKGELVGITTPEKIIIPIEFEYIYPLEGMFVAKKDELRGLFSPTGEMIQPIIHTYILAPRTDRNAIIFTQKDDKYGILDMKGKTLYKNVFKQRYSIPDTEQNLNLLRRNEATFYQALQHKNGKFGVLDVFTGKFCLPLEYDGVYQKIYDELNNKTYFLVSKDGNYGLVDGKNNIIINLKYEQLDISLNRFITDNEDFKNVAFVAQKNGKFGIINISDEILVPFEYQAITKIGRFKPLFKAKKNSGYQLINNKNEILNPVSFDEIANFEYRHISKDSDERHRVALAFANGKMREIDENGQFLSEPISMQPHNGYQSLIELKLDLIDALNSSNDSALYYFAEKITPSDHLMYLLKDTDSEIRSRTQYLHYESITHRYYQKLLEFKYSTWKRNFDIGNIQTEDYTTIKEGFVTNHRISNWAYGDTRILEKFLRNSLKINGYWISGYFLRRYF